MAAMTRPRTRLAVYTVLTGSKEPLGDPLAALPPGAHSDLDLHFVCFTDNPAPRSDVWELRRLDRVPLPPEKLSRRPKALPHEYLADFDFSLYVDNIVVFKRLPRAADLCTDAPYLFKVYRHATRSDPRQEAEAIAHIGYEQADRLCAQLDHYERLLKVDEIGPLSTCTVILRQHRHPALVALGVTWWEQILNFSKRDQMSFDFAVRWSGARLEHLPGLKHDNDLIHNTTNLGSQRVLANFDAVKYAWRHRDDPAAQLDPRQHWLDQRRCATEADLAALDPCTARTELLEFLCHRHGASLGRHVAPRRQVAGALQDLLAPWRARGARLLIVRLRHDGATAYTPDELDHGEAAILHFLTNSSAARLELAAAELASGQLVFKARDGVYDVVLVIGVPGLLLLQAQALVAPALAPQRGLLCLLAAQSCEVADIARAQADLQTRLKQPCGSSVQASRHDGADPGIANSVVAFQWGRT
jgi:hypothetical protein